MSQNCSQNRSRRPPEASSEPGWRPEAPKIASGGPQGGRNRDFREKPRFEGPRAAQNSATGETGETGGNRGMQRSRRNNARIRAATGGTNRGGPTGISQPMYPILRWGRRIFWRPRRALEAVLAGSRRPAGSQEASGALRDRFWEAFLVIFGRF